MVKSQIAGELIECTFNKWSQTRNTGSILHNVWHVGCYGYIDVKIGSPELVQIINYLKSCWSPNTISSQNLFRYPPWTVLKQPSLVHYIWTAHIVMKAITTNVGAGFIMEKKLRRNCFSHFLFFVCVCVLLDKEFEEWDGPVAEQLNWIEEQQANDALQNVTSFSRNIIHFIHSFILLCL